MNLKQMNVREYSLKLTKLSKYAPLLVVDPHARMNKFMSGVSDLVLQECHIAMMVKDMDISHLMTYVEWI